MDDTAIDDRNIVLTGFMGTGKTTVGRLLAARLGFDFVDTDAEIERRHGPIPEIFERQGEDAFRSYERAEAVALATRRRLVISTGGRLMLDPANAAALGATGRVWCLTADPAVIVERVTADGSAADRPLLATGDPRRRIAELLAERAEGYRRFAQIETDRLTPDEVVARLVAALTADAG